MKKPIWSVTRFYTNYCKTCQRVSGHSEKVEKFTDEIVEHVTCLSCGFAETSSEKV